MSDLGVGTWPTSLATERLEIREPREEDRDGLIDLHTSPEVRRHLGGPLPRERAEEGMTGPCGRRPGSFVMRENGSGSFVGIVDIDRRDSSRPGHLLPTRDELEISYLLLPLYWGKGYAEEAVRAVLGWAASTLPDTHVVAVTQVANTRSVTLLERLGFTEVERFPEFGAEQSLCVAELYSFRR
jgi:RimJ/RimL family protein N-acetyltransferase